MRTRLPRLGAPTFTTGLLGLSLATLLLPFTLSCSTFSNQGSYSDPAPAISSFTTGTMTGTAFTPTPPGTTLKVQVGGNAWLRANFSVKDGGAVVNPGNRAVETNVPFQFTGLTATTDYTLTVTSGSGKTFAQHATVVVLVPPSSLHYLSETATYYKGVQIAPNTMSVAGGGSYLFSVSPELPPGLVLDSVTGTISGTPQAVTPQATYTVTAKDEVNQSTTRDLTFTVVDTPLDFSLNPTNIAPGGAAILAWDASKVPGVFSGVTISAVPADASLPGTFALKGTANVTPAVTTTYTINATPTSGGPAVSKSIGLTVGIVPVAITAFDASPAKTAFGGVSTLTWSLTGVPLTLTVDGADVLSLPNLPVHPARRQTYLLSGSNALNSKPDTKTVTVVARGLDTFAGLPTAGGWLDATGTNAKVYLNTGPITSSTAGSMNLSMDPSGNLLVADALNHVVRMVSPAGAMTTLAGRPGVSFVSAAADGTGSGNGAAARFNRPAQLIYGDANTLYEIDYGTHSLRALAKQADGTWTVSLLAGTPGTFGNTTTQNLDNPLSIALYNNKIFIADGYTSSIRVFDPAAAVGSRLTTLAGGGTGQQFGLADGSGAAARFRTCSSIAIDPVQGDIYVADRENHAIRKVTQAGVVTTLAGAYPTATAGNVDASGTAARFNRPTGLVRASDGTLFVTDNGNHTLRKLAYNAGTSQWDVTTIAGTGTAGYQEGTGTAAAFYAPEGLAMDASGNLFVADTGNFMIRKLTASGSPAAYTSAPFVGLRQSGKVDGVGIAARFAQPNGVAVDKNGTIYVADEGNKVVRKIATDGTTSAWGTGVTLTAPYTLSVDDNLNVYVLDRLASTIAVVKIDAAGAMSTVTLTGVTFANNNPRGIAVTKDGKALFLADGNNLRKFDLSTGAQTASITTGLSGVNGIAPAADGVYWVEFSSHTVKKAALDLTGAAVVAGTASTKGFVDGAATTVARFNQPVALALALDASGNAAKIYVVDQGNHALRLIDRTNGDLVSTLVGVNDVTVVSAGIPTVMNAAPGTLSTTGTAGLFFPKGVGINALGDLFVTTSDGVMQVTAP